MKQPLKIQFLNATPGVGGCPRPNVMGKFSNLMFVMLNRVLTSIILVRTMCRFFYVKCMPENIKTVFFLVMRVRCSSVIIITTI